MALALEILVRPTIEPSTPTAYNNSRSLPSSMTTVPSVDPMSIESTQSSLGLDCQHFCCTDRKPYHPTQNEIKRTSTTQITKGESSNVRTCPSSIFLKYAWVTYCMTKGTIACYFCKRAMHQNLITFSLNGEKAFI